MTTRSAFVAVVRFQLWLVLAGSFAVAASTHLDGVSTYLALPTQFALQAVLAAAVIALLAAAARRWRALAFALATVAIAGVSIVPWDAPPACGEGTPRHRVLFFNTWVENVERDAVLAAIRAADADVVVLAEPTTYLNARLSDLAYIYPHVRACADTVRCDITVLSKTPIEDIGATEGRLSSPTTAPFAVTIDGRRLVMAGIHLTRPYPFDRLAYAQPLQAGRLGDYLGRLGSVDLVVGDFNSAWWTDILDLVAAKASMRPVAGGLGSWPSLFPAIARLPIDNALVGPNVSCASRSVLDAAGSDHLPILVEFGL